MLVEDRRRYWQTLQYLSGVHEASLTALTQADIDELRRQLDEALAARETAMDDIARAMTELATSTSAPAPAIGGFGGVGALTSEPSTTAQAPAPSGGGMALADRPVWLDPADEGLCTDCGTCYQELPQFFERTTKIIDGAARPVAVMIEGSLESVDVTPALQKRIDRVKANCDAEIIK